ncbi:MAG: zinc-binding dehydrogenase [Actinobacteria bacterium]|nr:zinc-binding dehydrogenase [Actinomycetota bacterium]
MRAVVYDVPGSFEVRDVPDVEPGSGQVRVRMTRAGMCGTDLHLHDGQFLAAFPLTPGHETVGVIDAIGPGAVDGEGRELAVGQQVVVNPNSSCRSCDYCAEGRPWLCDGFAGIGSSTPGGFADYVVVPGAQLFDATGIDPDLAVFAEPSACIAHLMDRLDPLEGQSVVVLGAGPTGVLLIQILRYKGAGAVTLADPNPAKLDRAAALSAIETTLVDRDDVRGSLDAIVAAHGGQFDIVIDATGRAAVIGELPRLARNGGRIVYYGVADESDLVAISPFEIFRRELTIMGSFTEVDSFPDALPAFRAGAIRMDGVITHRFALGDYADALDALRSDRTAHKIVIEGSA